MPALAAERLRSLGRHRMAERGIIDISTEFPRPWTDETVKAADVVITMGGGDACPSSRASVTRSRSSTTPPARTSPPSAPSATRSSAAFTLSSNSCRFASGFDGRTVLAIPNDSPQSSRIGSGDNWWCRTAHFAQRSGTGGGGVAKGADDDYWDETNLRSVFKHDLLGRYVPQFGGMTGSQSKRGRLVYLDGYAGRFILIGAEPFTDWLPEQVRRDQWGYVPTRPDLAQHWPLARAPLLLETSLPGVFAIGDVRHGSVKRVASAVGEGSICIRLVHEYLALAS